MGEPEGEGEGEGEVEREAEERRARPISEKTLASSVRPGMFSEMRSRLFLRSSRKPGGDETMDETAATEAGW